jgi:hypothetical protein
MRTLTALLALPLGLLLVPQETPPTGYTDTPMLPGQKWRVHDDARPRPRVVTPGEGTAAPSDAIVLFDGSSLDAWSGDGGKAAGWALEGGAMVVNGTGAIRTRETFGDVQLHLEFATPAEVVSASQGRGNSGVFFMERYEVQVLDSFENVTYADGQAGSLYGQFPPLVNASRKPGAWQTYDIVFRAPVFENGELVRPVQDAQELIGGTTHKKVATYAAHAATAPLQLQDHGNPVRYRNIWIRRL